MIELGTPQIERIVASRFAIAVEGRTALRGRLEHLRRLGTPSGIQRGQGRAAIYRWRELLELIVALELLSAGLTPEHAHRVASLRFGEFEQAFALLSFDLGAGLLAAVEQRRIPAGVSAPVLVTADAFSGMRGSGSSEVAFAIMLSPHYDIHDLPGELSTSRITLDVGPVAVRLLHAMSKALDIPQDLIVHEFKEWAIANVCNP